MYKKLKKAAVITALILLLIPTWDVLIAYCIYIPAKIFWSGDTIKRQVTTDTIHYDNFYQKFGPVKSDKKDFFKRKNKYAEMEIFEIYHYSLVKEKCRDLPFFQLYPLEGSPKPHPVQQRLAEAGTCDN